MKNFEGDTALHEAVRHNGFEIVKLLIHEDSNLASVLNGYGESPLFMAVDRCFYEIALLILNATAPNNCSFDGRNGMNFLHAAVIRAPIPTHLGNRELVELFLNHNNILVYKKNEKVMSAMKVHVDVVRTLINKCLDICELKDDRDQTALHVDVESREEEVVKFLLESIAFQDLINEKDNEGNTALHTASSGGVFKILQILLEIMSELEREVGLLGLERKLIRETKEAEDDEVRQQKEQQTEHKKSEEEKRGKDLANRCLLIATIIATATFAAAIQIAGGYDSQGIAILKGKSEFTLFIVYDLLAFFLSTFSILIQFSSPALGRFFTRYFTMILTTTLISASLAFMMFAFEQDIKAVLSPGLAKGFFNIPFTTIVTVSSMLITFSLFLCSKGKLY
nr:ankyrin repeat-containing protein ITN1-like [Ziziphus jujuba var. spinosa]